MTAPPAPPRLPDGELGDLTDQVRAEERKMLARQLEADLAADKSQLRFWQGRVRACEERIDLARRAWAREDGDPGP